MQIAFSSDCILQFIKVHPDAQLPKRNNNQPLVGDTGYDVFSVEDAVVPARGSVVVDVGLEFAHITPGFWVKVEGRSGLGFKHGILPHPGIIDNAYRGNCGIKLNNSTDKDYIVNKGDKIAQLVVYRLIEPNIEFTDTKQETTRGEKGFGSSGK